MASCWSRAVKLALAVGGAPRLGFEIRLLDLEPGEHRRSRRLRLPQWLDAFRQRCLGAGGRRFRLRCKPQCLQRGEQGCLIGLDLRLGLAPLQMQQQGLGPPDLARQLLVAFRLSRLPLQAVELRDELADDVAEAGEVAFGRVQPELGLVAAAVQAGDAGCILQHPAALLRLGVDDLADLALADQRRRAGAGRRVLEQQLDVAGTGVAAVDAVGGAGLALDAARDLDDVGVVELGRGDARGVVEEDRHFRPVAGRARVGAGEDHVVHGGGAHRLVRGLAHHPAKRLEQVRLAAAVRTDDPGQPPLDHKLGRLHERFEAEQA